MIEDKYIEKMDTIVRFGSDVEADHSNADHILCEMLEELGYTKLVELYHKVHKWYA